MVIKSIRLIESGYDSVSYCTLGVENIKKVLYWKIALTAELQGLYNYEMSYLITPFDSKKYPRISKSAKVPESSLWKRLNSKENVLKIISNQSKEFLISVRAKYSENQFSETCFLKFSNDLTQPKGVSALSGNAANEWTLLINPENQSSLNQSVKNSFNSLSVKTAKSGDTNSGNSSINYFSGRAFYTDRLFDKNGFYAQKQKPLRYIKTELISLNSPSSVIDSVKTDQTGFFSLTSGLSIIRPAVRFVSICGRGADVVKVYNTNWQKNTYSEAFSVDVNSSDTYSIFLTSETCAAFNICDVIVDCQLALEDKFKAEKTPPCIDIYWKPFSTTGSYQTGNSIYLLGASWDDDSFDDIIIGHEYGHFVHDTYSRNDTPGGDHNTADKIDPRLAWSEGWATYFSCIANNTPWYVDTRGAAVISMEIDTPTYHRNRFGIDNEISVASVLWDVTQVASADVLFNVFSKSMKYGSSLDLEDFWWYWFNPTPDYVNKDFFKKEQLLSIFSNRKMEYSSDIYEGLPGQNNNTIDRSFFISGASGCTESLNIKKGFIHNTFYGLNDEDWFSFYCHKGIPAALETRNLENMCDTRITLYDKSQKTVAFNDDSNSGLASRLDFIPEYTGLYYASVTNRSNTYRYGAYDFYAGHFSSFSDSSAGYIQINDEIKKPLIRQINVEQDIIIDSLSVNLEFLHKNSEQLKIELIDPENNVIQLLNGFKTTDYEHFFSFPKNNLSLDIFESIKGKSAKGIWTLVITDLVQGTAGNFISWNIDFFYNLSNSTSQEQIKSQLPIISENDCGSQLSWAKVESATLYEIQFAKTMEFRDSQVVYRAPEASCYLKNLMPDINWQGYFRVRALVAGYYTMWSKPVYKKNIDPVFMITGPTEKNRITLSKQDLKSLSQNSSHEILIFGVADIGEYASANILVKNSRLENESSNILINERQAFDVKNHWSASIILKEGINRVSSVLSYSKKSNSADSQSITLSDEIVIILDTMPPATPLVTGSKTVVEDKTFFSAQGKCSAETVEILILINNKFGVQRQIEPFFKEYTDSWACSCELYKNDISFKIVALDYAGNSSIPYTFFIQNPDDIINPPVILSQCGINYSVYHNSSYIFGLCNSDTDYISVNNSRVIECQPSVEYPDMLFWSFTANLLAGENDYSFRACKKIVSESDGAFEQIYSISSMPTKIAIKYTEPDIKYRFLSGPLGKIVSQSLNRKYGFTFSAEIEGKKLSNSVCWRLDPLEKSFNSWQQTDRITYSSLDSGEYVLYLRFDKGTSVLSQSKEFIEITRPFEIIQTQQVSDTSALIINEISFWPNPFIEIYNTSATPIDLSQVRLNVNDAIYNMPVKRLDGNSFICVDPTNTLSTLNYSPELTGQISLVNFSNSVIDSVTLGNTSLQAKSRFSIARDPFGTDTDDSVDFSIKPTSKMRCNLEFDPLEKNKTLIPGLVECCSHRPVSTFGVKKLLDNKIVFNNDFAVENFEKPVEIFFSFSKVVDLTDITIFNDGCFGANRVEILYSEASECIDRIETINDIEYHTLGEYNDLVSDNPQAPCQHDFRFNCKKAGSLKFIFKGFMDKKWFQLNEIKFYGPSDSSSSNSFLTDTLIPDSVWGTHEGYNRQYSVSNIYNTVIKEDDLFSCRNQGEDISLLFDFKDFSEVNGLVINNFGRYFSNNLSISSSNDLITWSETRRFNIFGPDYIDSSNKMNTHILDFKLMKGRFYKIIFNDFQNSKWFEVSEINFLTNLSSSKRVFPVNIACDSHETIKGYEVCFLSDEKNIFNSDTAFIHKNQPVEILFDFKMMFNISSLVLSNDGRFGAGRVFLSYMDSSSGTWKDFMWSGQEWADLNSSYSNPCATKIRLGIDKESIKTNAIRLSFSDFNDNLWFQLNEVSFFGFSDKMELFPDTFNFSKELYETSAEFIFSSAVSLDQIRIFDTLVKSEDAFKSPANILYLTENNEEWHFLCGVSSISKVEPDIYFNCPERVSALKVIFFNECNLPQLSDLNFCFYRTLEKNIVYPASLSGNSSNESVYAEPRLTIKNKNKTIQENIDKAYVSGLESATTVLSTTDFPTSLIPSSNLSNFIISEVEFEFTPDFKVSFVHKKCDATIINSGAFNVTENQYKLLKSLGLFKNKLQNYSLPKNMSHSIICLQNNIGFIIDALDINGILPEGILFIQRSSQNVYNLKSSDLSELFNIVEKDTETFEFAIFVFKDYFVREPDNITGDDRDTPVSKPLISPEYFGQYLDKPFDFGINDIFIYKPDMKPEFEHYFRTLEYLKFKKLWKFDQRE